MNQSTNQTLNKYNNLYQKIGCRKFQHLFDNEYINKDDKLDIVVKALSRNKKLTHKVLYVNHDGQKSNNCIFDNNNNIKSELSYSQGLTKLKQKKVYDYDFQKQQITFKEIFSESLSKINAPTSTQIVEYNLQSCSLKDMQIINLVNNLDYFCNFRIKEVILNLSHNSTCDNEIVQLISQLPKFRFANSMQINLENTKITDHSIRFFHSISSHFECLKQMKLNLKKTQVSEKQSYFLVDAFNSIGIELQVDCDHEKVSNYSLNSIESIKQKVEIKGLIGSKVSQQINQSEKINSKSSNKLQSKLIEKKKILAAQNITIYSVNDSNCGISDIDIQPFSSYLGNMSEQQVSSQNQSVYSAQQPSNKYKQSSAPLKPFISSNQVSLTQQQSLYQEVDVKRKTPEEVAAEKNLEDGYGKGFKILMGLGYKLGKGLGKNDQGITEPVQPKNKSKFKQNNQNRSNIDYFENLSKQNQTQGLNNMIKFEKKSTLIINEKGVENILNDGENNNIPSKSSSSNSKAELNNQQKNSSKSKGSANKKQLNILQNNPYSHNQNQYNYGNINGQQLQYNNSTTPNTGGINYLHQQKQYQIQQQIAYQNVHPSRMV